MNCCFVPGTSFSPYGALPDSAVERLATITAFGFAPSDDRIVTDRAGLIAAIEEMLPTFKTLGRR